MHGDILGILRPIHRGILWFCGFDVLSPHIVYSPVRQTQQDRDRMLAAYAQRLRHIESETPIDVGAYG